MGKRIQNLTVKESLLILKMEKYSNYRDFRNDFIHISNKDIDINEISEYIEKFNIPINSEIKIEEIDINFSSNFADDNEFPLSVGEDVLFFEIPLSLKESFNKIKIDLLDNFYKDIEKQLSKRKLGNTV